MVTWIGYGLQIALLGMAFYYLFLLFRGTRGVQIFLGLALVIGVMLGMTELLEWAELNWVLRRFSVWLTLAVLIIFQPEIRRALAELGRRPVFTNTSERRTLVDRLVRTVQILSQQRVGALMAVERNVGTRSVQETGVLLDAEVEPDLLASLFFPHTPLHDGGVIIKDSRIVAAGCVFPLTDDDLHKQFGTRHRAAVGLSEETDAVVIVVSEETGGISACFRGRLAHGLDEERLRHYLSALLVQHAGQTTFWGRVKDRLNPTAPDELFEDGIRKEDPDVP